MSLLKNVSNQTIKGSILQNNANAMYPFVTARLNTQASDDETFTIGSVVFEFYPNAGDPATVTAGNVAVEIGAAAFNSVANLIAAINAQVAAGNLPEIKEATDVGGGSTFFLLVGNLGFGGTAVSTDVTGGALSDTELGNEVSPVISGNALSFSYVATALDVTLGFITFPLTFDAAAVMLQIHDDSNQPTVPDGVSPMLVYPTAGVGESGKIQILNGGGTQDYAADYIIHITAIK